MSRDRKKTSVTTLGGADFRNVPNELGAAGDTVYVSPTIKMATQQNIEYVSVFNPKTKETLLFRQRYGIGGPTVIDYNTDYIGIRNADGTYTTNATTSADFMNDESRSALANEKNVLDSLENNRNYTYRTGYALDNNGQKPTPIQTSQALNNPATPDPPTADPQTGDDANDDGGDGSTLATLQSVVDDNGVQQAAEAGNLSEDLRYPVGSPTYLKSDYIRFSAVKYEPATISTDNFAISYNPGEVLGASVYLPIQGGISDSNGVGWNEEVMNPIQIAGADIAMRTMGEGGSGLMDAANDLVNKIAGNSDAVKAAIKGSVTESAIGANILPRTSRAIFNPNTELLFNGPQLRAFTFTFKLLPRNATEAANIKKIIRFFKVNMAARTTEAQLFLKAPNIFRIEYIHKEEDNHRGLNLIKDCALQNFSVDYTPDGSYMTVGDDSEGTMFSYNLTMSFMELVPVYSKDYDDEKAGNHPIGY